MEFDNDDDLEYPQPVPVTVQEVPQGMVRFEMMNNVVSLVCKVNYFIIV